jgi:hypothetical protein
MSIMDNLRSGLREWLGVSNDDARNPADYYNQYAAYRSGEMRSVFKQKVGQPDFNIVIPQTRQIQDRSVSFLLNDGIEFDLGEDDTTQQDYIDVTWKKNSTAQSDAVLLGTIFGTSIVKIVPNHFSVGGVGYPRFIPMNPNFFAGVEGGIDTSPEDKDMVVAYRNRFNVSYNGDIVERLEVTERKVLNGVAYPPEYSETWTVTNYIRTRDTSGKWAVMGAPQVWPYSFPPYHHWQNLRNPLGPFGEPDVDLDALVLNDKENMVAGNTLKIIMMQAHPIKYTTGAKLPDGVEGGPDAIWQFTSPDVKVGVLEGANDLTSSQNFFETLRQVMFSSTRTVDINSMADKVGALTNFGLRVLFMDEMNKTRTKRKLIGAGFVELNRRALILAGFSADIEGGEPIWQDPLPVNEVEQAQTVQVDLGAGIVSKQTASETRGYDWETEQERMDEESQGEQDNIGAGLLRFQQGFGGSTFGRAQQQQEQQPAEQAAVDGQSEVVR